jgi:hypothetical protein
MMSNVYIAWLSAWMISATAFSRHGRMKASPNPTKPSLDVRLTNRKGFTLPQLSSPVAVAVIHVSNRANLIGCEQGSQLNFMSEANLDAKIVSPSM